MCEVEENTLEKYYIEMLWKRLKNPDFHVPVKSRLYGQEVVFL